MPWPLLAVLLLGACSAGAPVRPSGSDAQASNPAAGEAAAEQTPVPDSARRDHEAALDAMRREDWTEAELLLEQLTLQHPSLPGPHVNAAVLYMRDGRDDEALAALEKALALEPNHGPANNQLGILLRRRGEFDAAEQAYRRAIENDPAYALPLYNLGVLLDLYLHRPSEALALYERYQDALPEPDETVGRWIIDLRRRVGAEGDAAARVAPGEGS